MLYQRTTGVSGDMAHVFVIGAAAGAVGTIVGESRGVCPQPAQKEFEKKCRWMLTFGSFDKTKPSQRNSGGGAQLPAAEQTTVAYRGVSMPPSHA